MGEIRFASGGLCLALIFSAHSYSIERGVDKGELKELDTFVNNVQRTYKVPGIAVGIIKNGQIVYSKGFGYRDRETKAPVTSETLFGLGSTSKAFTAITAALMVDAGKLHWDEPVRKHLKNFSLADANATINATARDLLSHQVGQARHDMMWLGSPFTREGIFSRLQFLAFNLKFREQFQYSNLMYMSAGHLVEKVAGVSWESLVREKIFKALGMSASNTSTLESQKQKNFALPYTRLGSEIVKRKFRVLDNMGPAGSINSNINDMLKWLQYQLSGTTSRGQRLVSVENFNETHRPQVIVPNATYDRFPEFTRSYYAMGWTVHSYRSTALIRHGGSIGGFLATVALLPDLKAGVVVLQNSDHFDANNYIALRAYDLLLRKAPIDWISRLEGKNTLMSEDHEGELHFEDLAAPVKLDTDPDQTLSLGDYRGNYEDAGYGPARVSIEGDNLRLYYNDWSVRLKSLGNDRFEALGPTFTGEVMFKRNRSAKIQSLSMDLESTVAPITFNRL